MLKNLNTLYIKLQIIQILSINNNNYCPKIIFSKKIILTKLIIHYIIKFKIDLNLLNNIFYQSSSLLFCILNNNNKTYKLFRKQIAKIIQRLIVKEFGL